MIIHALKAVTTNLTSAEFSLQNLQDRDEVLVQVDVSDAGSVAVQGRLSRSAQWQTLATLTVNGLQAILRVPYMQFVVTGNTGTINAFIA